MTNYHLYPHRHLNPHRHLYPLRHPHRDLKKYLINIF